ncbi:hypothetical protein MNBD_GAMMA03-907 [hydrothermal vent metagenome]|uniref:Uncharacterized protein n=1 Tax=hydrothermal vent metagenome TaxID=652676 RepID=A0A3B0VWX7_9ZZZZ
MNRKNTGIILVISGILICVVSLMFSQRYYSQLGLIGSIPYMELDLSFSSKKQNISFEEYLNQKDKPSSNIKTKYILLLGVILILVGFYQIFKEDSGYKNRKKKHNKSLNQIGAKNAPPG